MLLAFWMLLGSNLELLRDTVVVVVASSLLDAASLLLAR
jgi:hypothetical protein